MYSLDSYVQKIVKSKGPINMLSVDTEGWDFDVLFGGSTTLDEPIISNLNITEGVCIRFFLFALSLCRTQLAHIIIFNKKLGKL